MEEKTYECEECRKTLKTSEEIPECCGKRVINKSSTSTNLHPEDQSGVGKDFVTEGVNKIVFYKDWEPYHIPPPTAITYGQRKQEIKINDLSKPLWIHFQRQQTVTKRKLRHLCLRECHIKVRFLKVFQIIQTLDIIVGG